LAQLVVHERHAGNVSARPAQARDETGYDRIESNDKNDRYRCGRCFCSERGRRPGREDQIDRTLGQFRCQSR